MAANGDKKEKTKPISNPIRVHFVRCLEACFGFSLKKLTLAKILADLKSTRSTSKFPVGSQSCRALSTSCTLCFDKSSLETGIPRKN